MINELIQGCLQGNRNAQRKLYEHFHPSMMGVCMRYAGNRDEALEVLNTGFLKVFKNLKSFDPEVGVLEAWIRRIMVNCAIDHYRKAVRRERTADIDNGILQISGFEENAVDRLCAEEIMDCVQQLSPAYRTVFNLFVIEGYSHPEIGKRLGISEGTSKSNLAKARMRLRTMIENVNTTNGTQEKVEYAVPS